jgi:hypothetical protein
MENMILMGDIKIPKEAISRQIAEIVDLIVQVKRLRDGSRRTTNITEVIGMEGDVIVTQELFKFEYLDETDDGKIIGEFRPSGLRPYTGKGPPVRLRPGLPRSLPPNSQGRCWRRPAARRPGKSTAHRSSSRACSPRGRGHCAGCGAARQTAPTAPRPAARRHGRHGVPRPVKQVLPIDDHRRPWRPGGGDGRARDRPCQGAAMPSHERPFLARLRLAAMVMLSLMLVLVKLTGERGMPLPETMFWRQTLPAVMLLGWLGARGNCALAHRPPWVHFRRAMIGTAGMFLTLGVVQILPWQRPPCWALPRRSLR